MSRIPLRVWICVLPAFVGGVLTSAARGEPLLSGDQPARTLYIAADSTAASGDEFVGWGDALQPYFEPAKLVVINYAKGGTNSRNYVRSSTWEQVKQKLRPGDFVLIQFGHSEKIATDSPKNPGPLPSTGTETSEGRRSDGTAERIQTFGSYLRQMIAEVKQRGGTPILLSSTPTNAWRAGHFVRTDLEPNVWTKRVAIEAHTSFIDVFTALAVAYQREGGRAVRQFFPVDHLHTNRAGAEFTARTVAALLAADTDLPLGNCLSTQGAALLKD